MVADERKRYNIYYTKYNVFANDYIPYIKIVETTDIYHEIGKMICTSFEKIDSIRYTESKASREDLEKLWLESNYIKIGENLWRQEKRHGRKDANE